jgi:signal transduction histidine kinase
VTALPHPHAPAVERNRTGRRSLKTRLIAASVVFATLIAIVFAVLVLAISELRTATEDEAHAKDRSVAALELEKLVLDVETGARGLVITGDERFLEPWTLARRQLPTRLTDFERRFAGSPQRSQARILGRSIRAYVNDYSLPLVALARVQPGAAQTPVATVEGKRRIDAIRSRFGSLLAAENRAAAASAASARTRGQRAIIAGVSGLAVSALLIVLFGVYLARAIARPLRAAAVGATRLAEGDLGTRLESSGPGEVGELAQAFNDMAERLQSNRLELEDQNKRLRESERRKAELISIVSHELRTPLASILGFAELLRRRDIEEPARSSYLEIVSTQSQRLATLLDDFLDAQLAEEGHLELAAEPIDMGTILREQARVFVGQSDRHEIRLALDEPLPVRADSGRMTQVVANLLSNAIKYSPDGGLVEVAGSREAKGVRIRVRDHGVGIPEEEQRRIFTKFFRGGAAASGITGAGLGLALSREIVEAHGGGIGFSSTPGDGTTFWLELPADEQDRPPPATKGEK